LDVLSVTGLLNYIGKLDLSSKNDTPQGQNNVAQSTAEQGGIKIKPVLLQKGQTKLAIYPLGNVKDQRLHFELRSNRVRMYMPRDKEDWFNVLMVHQNRFV
jgi:double-strand break repair protein MRE11